MAEQSQDPEATAEEIGGADPVEMPREISDAEKRLRREVARYREQVRIAQNERDTARAAAVRERDEAVEAARSDARHRILQAELQTHAIRRGILDLDALKLADTGGAHFDEAGNLLGIEDVVARLQADKPYLFGSDPRLAGGATTTQTQRAPQPAQPAALDARTLSREAWQAERDRLLAAHRG